MFHPSTTNATVYGDPHPQIRRRSTSIYQNQNKQGVKGREQIRTVDAREPTREDIIHLRLEIQDLRGKNKKLRTHNAELHEQIGASRPQRHFNILIVAYLVLLVLYLNSNRAERNQSAARQATINESLPWKHIRGTVSEELGKTGKNGLLLPVVRTSAYLPMPAPFHNLTWAQMGWVLANPYEALNFHKEFRANIDGDQTEHLRERKDLEEYVHRFLLPPWDAKGPLCDKNTGIYTVNVCDQARGSFREKLDCLAKKNCRNMWLGRDETGTLDIMEQRKRFAAGHVSEGYPWETSKGSS